MSTLTPSITESEELMSSLPGKVVHLRHREQPFAPEKSFYVVGTAHISKKSVDEVAAAIRVLKPQVIFLELCAERKQLLTQNFKPASAAETLAAWRRGEGTLLALLYSYFLASAAGAVEVAPGEEFRVALIEAKQIGARVVLGDRLVSVTIARAWASLSSWERVCFLSSLLFGGLTASKHSIQKELDGLEDSDALTEAVKEMGEAYPGLTRTLLDERNLYMVWMLRRLASQADRVVAVVGAGHVAGMQEHWGDKIDIDSLVDLPPKRSSAVPWRTVGVLSVLTLACTAYYVRARRR